MTEWLDEPSACGYDTKNHGDFECSGCATYIKAGPLPAICPKCGKEFIMEATLTTEAQMYGPRHHKILRDLTDGR